MGDAMSFAVDQSIRMLEYVDFDGVERIASELTDAGKGTDAEVLRSTVHNIAVALRMLRRSIPNDGMPGPEEGVSGG